ncbi:MAG: permease of phosphate ABC transporter [Otoolea sp.]|nr:permease of phosphate ABC transporter [Clostridium sp.]
MCKLFDYANQYVKESDWKDFAMLKLCLCAMGVIIGVHVEPKHKKMVTGMAAGVFAVTYIPLMAKFIRIISGSDRNEQ